MTKPGTGDTPPPNESQPGDVLFGRFEVLRSIGAGGMGTVCLVADRELSGTRKALKLLDPRLANNLAARAQFKQEVMVAQTLAHGRVIRVFDLHEDGNLLGFSMAFLDGSTLRQHLLGDVPASPLAGPGSVERLPLVAMVAGQLASALDFVHSRGLVHRDVKPSNVMIGDLDLADPRRPRVETTLLDFGIASLRGRNSGSSSSQGGTAGYQAPELVPGLGRNDPTPAADIYAFGLVVYQMLTGVLEPPTRDMATPSERVPGLPELADEPVMACFNQRENRPDRASDVAGALKAAAERWAKPVATEAILVAPPRRRRLAKRREKKRGARRWPSGVAVLVAGCLIFICCGALAAGGFYFEPTIMSMLGMGAHDYDTTDLSSDDWSWGTLKASVDTLNVYESGSSGARVLEIHAKGDTFEYYGMDDMLMYYKVKTRDGKYGYVSISEVEVSF